MKDEPNKALKLATMLYEKWFRDKATKERREKINHLQMKIERDFFMPVRPTLLEKRKAKIQKIQDKLNDK